jgi:16S rRNA (guanine966-N2)-methyltransferase
MDYHSPRGRKNAQQSISRTIRITGGSLRGRAISLIEKKGVRYTSSKVREAIFNILGDIHGKNILDLFAGAGSFTIEALSRGAATVTSVEMDTEMAQVLKKNLASLDLNNYCHVLTMDVIYAVPMLSKNSFSYDIIFMDPPYVRGHVEETMSALTENRIYDSHSLVVIEHSKREVPMVPAEGWRHIDTKGYGDTVVTILEAD